MPSRLTDDYLEQVRLRKNRYMGQWTGTAGSLAADCHRLMDDRKHLLEEIAEMQTRLDCYPPEAAHAAVDCGPTVTTSTDDIPLDWILQGERELRAGKERPVRLRGDGLMDAQPENVRPGSLAFMDVLEEIRQLHLAKTQDYGAETDALKNIRDGADVVNIDAWKACLIRMADKMTRLRSYCHTGSVKFDGVEDTLLDLAAYSAIALVLYREATRPAE